MSERVKELLLAAGGAAPVLVPALAAVAWPGARCIGTVKNFTD